MTGRRATVTIVVSSLGGVPFIASPTMSIRLLLPAILLLASAVLAQDFQPSDAERAKIASCIERTASEGELKQESDCIGLIADPCVDAPDATTASLVACHKREQVIWDGYLNQWYGKAQDNLPMTLPLVPRSKLRNAPGSPTATRNAPIGPNATRAAPSYRSWSGIACVSRPGGAHSSCAM